MYLSGLLTIAGSEKQPRYLSLAEGSRHHQAACFW